MSDDGILDHLRKAYYQEPAFLGASASPIGERLHATVRMVDHKPLISAKAACVWEMISERMASSLASARIADDMSITLL